MLIKYRLQILAILAVLLTHQLFAQPNSALTELRRGITLFAEARYTEALPVFDALLLQTNAGDLRAEGLYWSALTHIAMNSYPAAKAVIDTFLELYPGHNRLEELLYQQGRIHYIMQEYEKSLQILKAFITLYPEAEVYASALFWIAESLYELGRFTDAEKIYTSIREDHRDSIKAEAAAYRIDLIRFKYREEELLTLLKWSHEESLKVIEEFQRREKAYEQALNLYQKRYGDLQQSISGSDTNTDLAQQNSELTTQLQTLRLSIAAKDRQIASLTAAASTTSVQSTANTEKVEDSQRLKLIELKERTLELLSFYLTKLVDQNSSKEAR
ncbi:MAG: tetratricopeptide repeat protein [Spirochaetes bacterium]|nr:tetratricopeptide repeat protein [Spirochaetota bacterium]MBU0953796.1 tetratricopeptide repeat protein [Spirochaetota bacterium]